MLAKQHRYPFHSGLPRKSVHSPYFVLRYQESQMFRVGIVVSKKTASHAVDRNKLKRVYKRVLKKIIVGANKTYDLVFYLRKRSAMSTEEEIYNEVEQIFKKEGII